LCRVVKCFNAIAGEGSRLYVLLTFLIDNIFVMFGGHVSQQTVGIPMGTNCAPLLVELFLYSYEADL
jgi:hypothetical protein